MSRIKHYDDTLKDWVYADKVVQSSGEVWETIVDEPLNSDQNYLEYDFNASGKKYKKLKVKIVGNGTNPNGSYVNVYLNDENGDNGYTFEVDGKNSPTGSSPSSTPATMMLFEKVGNDIYGLYGHTIVYNYAGTQTNMMEFTQTALTQGESINRVVIDCTLGDGAIASGSNILIEGVVL